MNDSLISSSMRRGRIRSRLFGAVIGGEFSRLFTDLEIYPKTRVKATAGPVCKSFIGRSLDGVGLSRSHTENLPRINAGNKLTAGAGDSRSPSGDRWPPRRSFPRRLQLLLRVLARAFQRAHAG